MEVPTTVQPQPRADLSLPLLGVEPFPPQLSKDSIAEVKTSALVVSNDFGTPGMTFVHEEASGSKLASLALTAAQISASEFRVVPALAMDPPRALLASSMPFQAPQVFMNTPPLSQAVISDNPHVPIAHQSFRVKVALYRAMGVKLPPQPPLKSPRVSSGQF